MALTPEEQQFQNQLMSGEATQKAEADYVAKPDLSFEEYAKQSGVDVDSIKKELDKENMESRVASIPLDKSPTASQIIGNPGKGAALGLVDLAQTVTNGAIDLANWVEDTASQYGIGSGDIINDASRVNWSEKLTLPQEELGTRAMRSITKYAAPVVATMGAGAGPATAMGIGALSDFFLIDPKGERLSDMMVNEIPELKNYPIAYNAVSSLASKPDDTELASRFKNMVEGLAIGAPIAAGLYGISKLSRIKPQAAGVAADAMPKAAAEAKAVGQDGAQVLAQPPLQGDLFDFAGVKVSADGTSKFNFNNDNVLNYAAEFAKANPEGAFGRGPKVFSELDAEAKSIINDTAKLDKLLSWRLGDRPLTDAETKASQYLMRNSTDSILEAANKYVVSKNKEDLVHLNNMVATRNYLANVKTGAGSEAGRALNAHKVSAEMAGLSVEEFNKIITKEGQAKLLDDILKFSGGEKDMDNLAKAITALGEKSPEDVALAVERASRESLGNVQKMTKILTTTAINSMLGFKTTVANHVNNAQTNLKMAADMYAAALTGTVRGNQDAISVQQANKYFTGMMSGVLEGFQAAGTSLKTGRGAGPANVVKLDLVQSPELFSDVLEIPMERNLGYKILGKVADGAGLAVGLPSRLNATADSLWGTMSYRAKLNMMAQDAVEEAGLKGADAAKFISNFTSSPSAQTHEVAKAWAEEMTFSRRLDPGSWADTADKLIEKTPMGRVLFPFFKTSTNVLSYTANNSPLALFIPGSKTLQALKAGGKEADLAAAKVTTGTIAVGLGAYLASSGMYSGPDTQNPRIRQALSETDKGWKPESILVNGEWSDIRRLDYVNSVLKLGSVVAATRNYVSEDEYGQLASVAGAAVADFLTPEMMVDTYTRYLEAISGVSKGEEKGMTAASNIAAETAAKFIPLTAMQREVSQQVDPFKTDTKIDSNLKGLEAFTQKILNKYKAVNPWLSKDLPVQRNVFGEPLLVPFGSMEAGVLESAGNYISPFASQKKENSALVKTLSQLAGFYEQMGPIDPDIPELPISMPPRTFAQGGVSIKLSPKEYEKYVMYSAGLNPETGRPMAGESLRDALEGVRLQIMPEFKEDMSTLEYKALVGAFSRVISQYRKAGRSYMNQDNEVMKKWQKAFDASTQLKDFSAIDGE